ncbi:hypothetical protein T01_10383 [Trichinella spiralis]|uniref:Uncharacterized protein n=2 Tax=Trichinella spiralis TaxID=6334 RepID=A0A0V1BN72_TRISP|nr:hypothetical protein T01_10383 [Trichinella spiralis]
MSEENRKIARQYTAITITTTTTITTTNTTSGKIGKALSKQASVQAVQVDVKNGVTCGQEHTETAVR